MGVEATIDGSASSTGVWQQRDDPCTCWRRWFAQILGNGGAISTEVVVEIDEGCMRKARLAPAHSRELTQPRARKRDHAKETPGFGHGSGAEGWLPRAYRREVRKWLRDLWGLLVFAIWDFFTQTPLPGRTGRQVRVGRRRWYLPGRHTRRWGTRCEPRSHLDTSLLGLPAALRPPMIWSAWASESITSLAIRYHILRALRSCLSIPTRYAMRASCS
jgi:hypothetical protein